MEQSQDNYSILYILLFLALLVILIVAIVMGCKMKYSEKFKYFDYQIINKRKIYGNAIFSHGNIITCAPKKAPCGVFGCIDAGTGNPCNYIWAVQSRYGYTAVTSDNLDLSINYISRDNKFIKTISLKNEITSLPFPQTGCVGGFESKTEPETMWFAMFGGVPSGGGSGLVKITRPIKNPTISWFPLSITYDGQTTQPNIHNCYQFYIADQWKIFGAVIGPFFINDTQNQTKKQHRLTRGYGLMEFQNSNWKTQNCLDLTVRSAKQIVWNNTYQDRVIVLTQNYATPNNWIDGADLIIEPTISEVYILKWHPKTKAWRKTSAVMSLQTTPGSEGGADVILGGQKNTYWISLRGTVTPTSTIVNIRETEDNILEVVRTIELNTYQPRYMVFIQDDLYICNQSDESLQIIEKLKSKPKSDKIVTIPSVSININMGSLMFIQ